MDINIFEYEVYIKVTVVWSRDESKLLFLESQQKSKLNGQIVIHHDMVVYMSRRGSKESHRDTWQSDETCVARRRTRGISETDGGHDVVNRPPRRGGAQL